MNRVPRIWSFIRRRNGDYVYYNDETGEEVIIRKPYTHNNRMKGDWYVYYSDINGGWQEIGGPFEHRDEAIKYARNYILRWLMAFKK